MWLPERGQFIGPDTETSNISNGFEFTLLVPGPSAVPNIITSIFPLVTDIPIDDDAFQGDSIRGLADIVGHDYFIKRIVGKMFAARRELDLPTAGGQLELVSTSKPTVFGAGLFVAKANDSDSGGGADQPVASATPAERNDNYSPLELDAIRDPWIWRRTWVLGAKGLNVVYDPAVTARNVAYWPPSTTDYGSMADGPHIDARTKRVVRHKDRLWLSVSAFALSDAEDQPNTNSGFVSGYFDYRIFGNIIKPRNRGNF